MICHLTQAPPFTGLCGFFSPQREKSAKPDQKKILSVNSTCSQGFYFMPPFSPHSDEGGALHLLLVSQFHDRSPSIYFLPLIWGWVAVVLPRGLRSDRHARNTSKSLNHLSWLLKTPRSSSSAPELPKDVWAPPLSQRPPSFQPLISATSSFRLPQRAHDHRWGSEASQTSKSSKLPVFHDRLHLPVAHEQDP